MNLGAKYTTYPVEKFKEAVQVAHRKSSDYNWDESSDEDKLRSRMLVYDIVDTLGPPVGAVEAEERIDSLRQSNLGQGEALNRIWRTMYGNRQPSHSNHDVIADGIIQGLQDKMPPPEITDQLVNEIALAAFGPSVVYDREGLRRALAQALQTR